MDKNLSDKEIVKLSKNKSEVFTSEDGRFAFMGKIYHSEEELKKGIERENKILESVIRTYNKFQKFKRWIFPFPKKK